MTLNLNFCTLKRIRPKTTTTIRILSSIVLNILIFFLTGPEKKIQLLIYYFFVKFLGDEILSVNGHSTQGLSHSEAIAIFKGIRTGKVNIHVARRDGNYTK